MPVDEEIYPGPEYDPVIHHGFFPVNHSPGDIYINQSRMIYINIGREWKRLTVEEFRKHVKGLNISVTNGGDVINENPRSGTVARPIRNG